MKLLNDLIELRKEKKVKQSDLLSTLSITGTTWVNMNAGKEEYISTKLLSTPTIWVTKLDY